MEGSTSNHIPVEDEIQPVNNEEITAEDDEQCQLLLNISIDGIDKASGDLLNADSESYSSNSSVYQMTVMEKFNFIATRILYSKYFQYYYFFVIILSIISLVLTYFLECTNSTYIILESLIILALIIEVTIRLLAQRKYYFYSFWNILDISILAVCIWLFSITKVKCPLNENDSIIDSSILIVRYIIQFIRLGLLLKKNKTSGASKKRKSINFSHLRRKSTYYGSFNPTSHNRRESRKNIKYGEERLEEDGDMEREDDFDYRNISNIISPRIYNPYGARYDLIDDSRQYYSNSIQNDSFLIPNTLSQSLARDYGNYFQNSQGSIDINIDSNANIAKILYHDEINGDLDNKKSYNQSFSSTNNDTYQKLFNSSVEDNNKNSYGGLPHPKDSAEQIISPSHQTNDAEHINDSFSMNANGTPTSSVLSPSSSYRKKYQVPLKGQKSFSSDVSFSISLPPKVGKKHNRIAQTNHSSTFNEVPNRVNLLTPILYGSPGTFSPRN